MSSIHKNCAVSVSLKKYGPDTFKLVFKGICDDIGAMYYFDDTAKELIDTALEIKADLNETYNKTKTVVVNVISQSFTITDTNAGQREIHFVYYLKYDEKYRLLASEVITDRLNYYSDMIKRAFRANIIND